MVAVHRFSPAGIYRSKWLFGGRYRVIEIISLVAVGTSRVTDPKKDVSACPRGDFRQVGPTLSAPDRVLLPLFPFLVPVTPVLPMNPQASSSASRLTAQEVAVAMPMRQQRLDQVRARTPAFSQIQLS